MNHNQNQTEEMFSIDDLMYDLFLYANQELHKSGKTHIEVDYSCCSKNDTYRIGIDEESLWQILVHLLNNAVKYTDKGFIFFGYQLSGTDGVVFFVNDTRSENFNENLSVVSALVEQKGSHLMAKPSEEKTSSFSFTVNHQKKSSS